ncbi:MAG: GlsB/YeaQ/YmgE family stress response membrane protein [Deltaproteobacteria bacterium]|nr:GlsB/YeaQ/YmgE family stress response membrane protein [Deltaproteobacteria bacterium]MBW1817180.1 GlsB/YeaQ/YmgE family stress response membrane protein [Deltaproteobacteria bacterium]
MGILSWIILGLIAGALAKWIMPGKDGGGIIVTMLLGIAGAFLGGWIGSIIGLGTTGGLSIGSIITATVGAILLLFIYRQIKKKK